MNAHAESLLAVFKAKQCLEVPLFQRQYTWNREQQWELLWEDISHKFNDYLRGDTEAPPHFLGAIILDQRLTPTGYVTKRQVIDGQQRLTTFQIFIAAFRDYCSAMRHQSLAEECNEYLMNKGILSELQSDRYKIWPTHSDRQQFIDTIDRQLLESVSESYGDKSHKIPRMIEAYFYFYQAISGYFDEDNEESHRAQGIGSADVSCALEKCFLALQNALRVVIIDLVEGDDAQVIFETLNGRGQPLLPADLLRNHIFLRALRQGESVEHLYAEYWKNFDSDFWREEIGRGRQARPHIDLFFQHFLASKQIKQIPIRHLFMNYKYWIEKSNPFESVENELACLSRQAKRFTRIVKPSDGDPLFSISNFLLDFDLSTVYPLLLWLLEEADIEEKEWNCISEIIESYAVRRTICGLTTRSYNRVFLGLMRHLSKENVTPTSIGSFFLAQKGPSSRWPDDQEFRDAWQTRPVARTMNNSQMVHVLRRLNDYLIDRKTERVKIAGRLSVEHILPRHWTQHWPLSDGRRGLNREQMRDLSADMELVHSTRFRDDKLETIGNVTILTHELNAAISNGPWAKKKEEIGKYSVLSINRELLRVDAWNEDTINERSQNLFEIAVRVWPDLVALPAVS